MSRLADVPHIRSAFRQAKDTKTILEIVFKLREIALNHILPAVPLLPRTLSKEVRLAYEKKGISTDWNLRNPDDATQFFLVANGSPISRSQKCAAQLLLSCSHVLETPSILPSLKDTILDAYAGLDFETVELAENFRRNQKAKAKRTRAVNLYDGRSIQQIIGEMLRKPENCEARAPELWRKLFSELDEADADPKEVTDPIDRKKTCYKYRGDEKYKRSKIKIAAAGLGDSGNTRTRSITFGYFQSLVSKARNQS